MLTLPEMKKMTFGNFQTREEEAGRESLTTTITEKQDKFGGIHKDKTVTRVKVSTNDIQTLSEAFSAAVRFSEEPHGWLVFLGQSFCGKTHLAAAIGNYRIALGGQAMLVEVSALFDYLRQSFHPSSDVSFDRRFQEIRATPLLLLDNLKESGASTAWAEDRLYSLLNYRYNAAPAHGADFCFGRRFFCAQLSQFVEQVVGFFQMPDHFDQHAAISPRVEAISEKGNRIRMTLFTPPHHKPRGRPRDKCAKRHRLLSSPKAGLFQVPAERHARVPTAGV